MSTTRPTDPTAQAEVAQLPSQADWVQELVAAIRSPRVLPLPKLSRPSCSPNSGGRIANRAARRRELWGIATEPICSFNRAYAGSAYAGSVGAVPIHFFPNEVPAPQRRAISLLLSAAKEIREARRLSPATGVTALEALLKKEAAEAYTSDSIELCTLGSG